MPRPEKKASRTRQVDKEPNFRDISEVERNRAYAFYGKSGTGKTTLAATFPKSILFDIQDEGTDSVKDIKGLKVWDIPDTDEFDDAYWYMKKTGCKKFDTAILDTATMLQNIKINEMMGDKLAKAGKQAGDWGTMTKQDWGTVSAYMKMEITRWRNLPMTVIFICQERIFNIDEDAGSDMGIIDPEVGPSLSPAVKGHLNAAVSVIGNTFIRSRFIETKDDKGRKKKREKIEYCLGIGPSSVYTRKIRKPRSIKLPDLIVDPTYEDIIEIIEGEE
jgi:hypothetical protein